ncbi:MAG TPA: YcnI family protein [Kineosporiaceae bacterium]
MFRSTRRLLTAGLLSGLALGLAAAPASAHVTVNPGQATQGGYSVLTFRMPTERDNASSTKLEVTFPSDAPLAHVSVKPVPGWTYTVEKAKLPQPVKSENGEITEAISKITWMAASKDTAVKPGEFNEFPVSAGPLPTTVDHMVFKAIQSYDNGEIVRWIEEAGPGAAEPKNPAPVLKLAAKQDAAPAAASSGGPQPSSPAQHPLAQHQDNSNNSATLPITLSLFALVVGLGAGFTAGLALRRARPAPAGSAS